MLQAVKRTTRTVHDFPAYVHTSGVILAAMAMTHQARAQETPESEIAVNGALATNQSALDAVESSSMTTQGFANAMQALTNSVMFLIGAVGVILTCWGIYNLWQHQKEGDRAQGSAMQGVFMTAIGGVMTIGAIIAGVLPTLLLGDEAAAED